MNYMTSDPNDLSITDLMEALSQSQGFIVSTQSYIMKKWGLNYPSTILTKMIKKYNLVDYVNQLRKKMVEDCYRKTYAKGVQEGDTICMQWYLNRYGHHVDFLDTAEGETDSKRDTKGILERIKGIQSEAD